MQSKCTARRLPHLLPIVSYNQGFSPLVKITFSALPLIGIMVLPTEAECGNGANSRSDGEEQKTSFGQKTLDQLLQDNLNMSGDNQKHLREMEETIKEGNQDLRSTLESNAEGDKKEVQEIEKKMTELDIELRRERIEKYYQVVERDTKKNREAIEAQRERESRFYYKAGQALVEGGFNGMKSPTGADISGDTAYDGERIERKISTNPKGNDGDHRNSNRFGSGSHGKDKNNFTSLIMPAPHQHSLPSTPYKHIPGPCDIVIEVVHSIKEKADAFFDGYIHHVETTFKKWSSWWYGEE